MKIIRHLDDKKSVISATDHFYPSVAVALSRGVTYEIPEFATAYGVIDGTLNVSSTSLVGQHAFCLTTGSVSCADGAGALFVRHGYRGQECLGVKIEKTGRLSYIDGCSDSLLIYPPRLGDPCLNALYFPIETTQSFHSHPTLRLGYVLSGSGIAETKKNQQELKTGDCFSLDPFEIHRFKTTNSAMVVIAYHPDSDWGPTDHVHPMRKRTYLADADQ